MRVQKRQPRAASFSWLAAYGTPGVSADDVLELLDLSIQGEQQCEQRIARARSTGEGPSIEYLENLKRHYCRAKEIVLSKLKTSGVSEREIRRFLAAHPGLVASRA